MAYETHDRASDEVLAQFLHRGSVSDWRSLYRQAAVEPDLRRRIRHIVASVPLPFPHFWLSALAALGETVDFDVSLPRYFDDGAD